MYNRLKVVKSANPTTVSSFLRLAGLLMHRLRLVFCILHVDLTVLPGLIRVLTQFDILRDRFDSVIIKFVKFSTGFTGVGIMSATILLTAFGEEGAFPPPVFLLSLLCSSNSFFLWIFTRFLVQPCVAFRLRLFPSGFLVLKDFAIFSHDVFFHFNQALLYPLFSI